MPYRLDASTVLDHLIQRGLCDGKDRLLSVKSLNSKNLNLLVALSRAISRAEPVTIRLLVKQSPFGEAGFSGEGFRREWKLYHWIRSCPELSFLWASLPDPVDYDPVSGILVFRFLEQYQELGKFYAAPRIFPVRLAAALGASVASLHQATYACAGSPPPLAAGADEHASVASDPPDLCGDLEDLTPDLFRSVPRDGLKFYVLYQRSPEISAAIQGLERSYQASCLIHHDLKFANILLHAQWSDRGHFSLPAQSADLTLPGGEGIIRLIDWEHWRWGDPAFDVGALVAEYLRIWLKSVPISRDLEPAASLQLAAVPLEALQPSIMSLIEAYLSQFPSILNHFPDFPLRVLRFAGLGLLKAIQDRLHYKEPFGNLEISMMQVGRSLLCHPEAALPIVFGCSDRIGTASWGDDYHTCGQECPALPLQSDTSQPSSTWEVPLGAFPLPSWPPHGSWHELLDELCAHVRLETEKIQHPAFPPLALTHRAKSDDSQDPSARNGALTAEVESAFRLHQIRNYLYAIYFSGELNQRRDSPSPLDDFTSRLEAANSGVGYADPGWIVLREEDGDVLVAKEGLHLWASITTDLVTQPHGMNPSGWPGDGSCPPAGASVAVRLPNMSWMGDYYVAIGDAGEPGRGIPACELYFHVTAEGAIVLMQACIKALNRCQCPFSLKVLRDPHWYGRRNGAVLRLPVSEYGRIRSLLMDSHHLLRSHLGNSVPLFTLPLAGGIGLAESPANGAEFGFERCELLANALLAAPPERQARKDVIQQHFRQRGLDWARPHLNPDSSDSYESLDCAAMPLHFS